MFGITCNDDAEMWMFKTTQDVKTIDFDMEVGTGGNTIGGGGAGWSFYTPTATIVPEPTCLALRSCGIALLGANAARRKPSAAHHSRL